MSMTQAIGKEHLDKLNEDVEMLDSLIPAPDIAKIHVRPSHHSALVLMIVDDSLVTNRRCSLVLR